MNNCRRLFTVSISLPSLSLPLPLLLVFYLSLIDTLQQSHSENPQTPRCKYYILLKGMEFAVLDLKLCQKRREGEEGRGEEIVPG
jgi:hypothetical protein